MSDTETWTVGRLIQWTTSYLEQRDLDTCRLDAELLLAEARGCSRIELYTAYDEVAPEETRTAFRELVRRRSEGVPVAYLLGRREFYSLEFRVTPDVLIPRPETELVVVNVLDQIKSLGNDRQLHIADVGTGSGIIGIAIAKHCRNCRITAVDISEPALKIAAENARAHGVLEQMEFVHSDLLAALPAQQTFDFIASNPPYVRTSEFEDLPIEVRQHEPRIALHAGEAGTEVIQRLVGQARERLRPGAWLVMEMSPMIVSSVRELLVRSPGLEDRGLVKDLAGHPRVVRAQRTE